MEEQANNSNDDVCGNPYMALRAAKIARNQARLKELGLYTFQKAKTRTTTRSNTKHSTPIISAIVTPIRRSSRISGQPIKANYMEVSNTLLNDTKRYQRGTKRSLTVHDDDDDADERIHDVDKQLKNKIISSKKSSSSSEPAANSVRSISLDTSKLVLKFLGKPIETFGKDFVIQNTFREAAYPEDIQRLQGASRLSFNKYCGVQEWKNAIYLWINLGGQNSLVNDFSSNGRRVSWFGGSKMREDSPVIQRLIHMGKERASNNPSISSSRIILWCRHYDVQTKKLLPYTCLGRLAYESHVPGSQPVAFTWRLIDYDSIMDNQATKEYFQEVTGSG
jgi:hypothetical protein